MAKWVQQIADIAIKNPYVDSFMAGVGNQNGGGGGGGGSANNGRLQMQLTPRATRPLSAQQIVQQLRPQLLRFPGFRGFVNVPSSIQIGGRQGNQNYSIMLQSLTTDELYSGRRGQWAVAQRVSRWDPLRSRDEEPANQPRHGSRPSGRRPEPQIQGALYDGLGRSGRQPSTAPAMYRVLLELDKNIRPRRTRCGRSRSRHSGALPAQSVVSFQKPSDRSQPFRPVDVGPLP
jgi:hypothetical protein